MDDEGGYEGAIVLKPNPGILSQETSNCHWIMHLCIQV